MNIAKLRGVIAERGKTQREVAAAIGVCEKTFYLKMKNGSFGINEVEKMVAFLQIENPLDIFLPSR
ncbi:MAG: DUF739 domain-containing protein [Oscillospiraceae bacterium]|nr:DUF739 domain-containing protein [Oscillospiraceae bacterium]